MINQYNCFNGLRSCFLDAVFEQLGLKLVKWKQLNKLNGKLASQSKPMFESGTKCRIKLMHKWPSNILMINLLQILRARFLLPISILKLSC